MNMADVLKKINQKGVKGCAESLEWHSANTVNKSIFYYWQKKPIDNNLIIMESGGEITDNAYALYDYMGKNGYLKKYHVVWLVYEISGPRKDHKIQHLYPNTEIVWGDPSKVHEKWNKYLATCKWYIYDHCNMMSSMKKRQDQILIYLSHGWGYKAAKGGDINNDKSIYDYMTATGPLSAKGLSEYWRRPLSDTLITGYPRIDYFYQDDSKVENIVNKKWQFSTYKKVFFWMPTFRKSIASALSEDYISNETGLPIFDTEKSLYEFSVFLKNNNILFVLKLHHLQADLPIFKKHLDNILVVHDEDLTALNIQLYQFIPLSDVLISDYSSISIDYLALNKPIIFTLDDYDQYDKSRGLFPKNAKDYMPGYHVYNQKELEDAIAEITDGIDKYKNDRDKVTSEYHTYRDGNSSKRVLDAIGIKL